VTDPEGLHAQADDAATKVEDAAAKAKVQVEDAATEAAAKVREAATDAAALLEGVEGLAAVVTALREGFEGLSSRLTQTRRAAIVNRAGLVLTLVLLVVVGLIAVDSRHNADRLASTVDGALCPTYRVLLARPPTPEQSAEGFRRVLVDGAKALGCPAG